MKDETYVFISDVKEKKVTARSARHARTHCGKGGRVRLPSDNLSKKELMKMNGECKSYRLNDPMAWNEFKAMPDDVKVTYIKLLRHKFNALDSHIANMMGINRCSFSQEMKRLGLSVGKHSHGKCTTWDKEGFYAWVNGVDPVPAPVSEALIDTLVIEEAKQEDTEKFMAAVKNLPIKAEPYVEDDLPFEEPEPVMDEKILTGIHPSQAELLKEELDKAKAENEWLRKELRNDQMQIQILQAQMEVVRMIFGGKNNGN